MLILIFLVNRKTVIYLGLVVLRLGKIALYWHIIQEEHILYKKIINIWMIFLKLKKGHFNAKIWVSKLVDFTASLRSILLFGKQRYSRYYAPRYSLLK